MFLFLFVAAFLCSPTPHLLLSGYRIDASFSRNEIQKVWMHVDTNPSTAGASGGSFRLQLETANGALAHYTSCIPWDATPEQMLLAFDEATWNHNGNPYDVVNVTRDVNHYSAGSGYFWTITYATSVGNAPSLNVTDGGACTSISAPFTQVGGTLSARTIIDGYVERSETLVENTLDTLTTKFVDNLIDSSLYAFKVSAIQGVGNGPLSTGSTLLSSLTTVGCLVQEWNDWSVCDSLVQSQKQCGEYVCRLTSCGDRVCGRRVCKSIDVSKINFNVQPNATADFQELDTESFQYRKRYVLQTPLNGGGLCPHDLTERRPCCSSAKTNKVVEIHGVKLVCNGSHYVHFSNMEVVEIGSEVQQIKVDGNGEIVSSSRTCRL